MKRLVIVLMALLPLTTGSAKAQYFWQKMFAVEEHAIEYLRLAENPVDGMLFAAVGSQRIRMSSDKGATWLSVNGDVPSSRHQRVAVAPSSGAIFVGSEEQGIWRLEPGDAAWARVDDLGANFGQVRGLAVTARGSVIFGEYTLTRGSGVYRSTDNGDSWHRIEFPALTTKISLWDIAFNMHNGNIYIGTADGAIHSSADDGQSWQTLRAASSNEDQITVWAFSPNGAIFGGARHRIFRSTDQGATWQMVYFNTWSNSGFFHGMAANTVGHVFACQHNIRNFVIYSSDNGASWDAYYVNAAATAEFGNQLLINRDGYILYTTNGGIYRTIAPTEPGVNEFASVSGTLALDGNSNCIPDDTDTPLGERIVEILPGPLYTRTDHQGRYKLFLKAGDYNVKLQPDALWAVGCDASSTGHRVTISENEHRDGLDLLIEPTQLLQALQLSIVSGRARPGRRLEYIIEYRNVGTRPFNGTLKLDYDQKLGYLTGSPKFSRHAASLMEWNLEAVPIGARGQIQVVFVIARDTERGSQVCAQVSYGNNQDLKRYSDLDYGFRDAICTEVTGSFDPNDIRVFPRGAGEQGSISRQDSVLSYLIRFQNTGNDTAFTVIIRDTLSKHLELTTLRFGASSHDYEVNIARDGALAFHFNNIMLPDSAANETASHGFIRYSVEQRPNLGLGSVIDNRAAIYFDFNKPVITNTVRNTLQSPVDVAEENKVNAIDIYPNPASEFLHLRADFSGSTEIHIVDVLGRIRLLMTHSGVGKLQIPVAELPTGRYLLLMRNKNYSAIAMFTTL